MPRDRFFKLPPKERAKLVKVAEDQFGARGFDGASLNEILAEAGLSKGAYYYYFDDKEDLFATVIESALDVMLARVPLFSTTTMTCDEFWPAVESFVVRLGESWALSIKLLRIFVHVSEAMRRSLRFAPIMERGREIYRPILETGRRLGCVRKDLPIGQLIRLCEAHDQAVDNIFLAHPKFNRAGLDKHAALVFDTLRRVLIAEVPSAQSRRRSRARIHRPRG